MSVERVPVKKINPSCREATNRATAARSAESLKLKTYEGRLLPSPVEHWNETQRRR